MNTGNRDPNTRNATPTHPNLTDEQIAFQILLHSGNARSSALTALREYRHGNLQGCRARLEEAEQSLLAAHETHSRLLQRHAEGEQAQHVILLMHAEDQLMAALTIKDLVQELVQVFETLKARDSG